MIFGEDEDRNGTGAPKVVMKLGKSELKRGASTLPHSSICYLYPKIRRCSLFLAFQSDFRIEQQVSHGYLLNIHLYFLTSLSNSFSYLNNNQVNVVISLIYEYFPPPDFIFCNFLIFLYLLLSLYIFLSSHFEYIIIAFLSNISLVASEQLL